MAYDRPATAGDVQRAQFLNYLRAPKPLQQAMQQYSPDSDAYRGIQNSMASAEEDIALQRGPNFNPNAGRLDWSGTAGRQPANVADLVQRTVGGLGPNHPLTSYLNPQAEQQRRAARQASSPDTQARIDGQTPLYRGMAGVGQGGFASGTGEMQNVLYPIAGRAREYSTNIGAVGLPGTGMTSQTAYEGARYGLVKQQEAGRRQAQDVAKAAGELQHNRNLEVAGVKAYRGAGKSGDTVGESYEKNAGRTYLSARSKWAESQRTAKGVMARLGEKMANPDVDPELDMINVGNQEMTLSEAQAWAEEALSDPGPQREEYFTPAAPAKTAPAATPGAKPAATANPQERQKKRNAFISGLDQSLWGSLDHNEREQFLASQGL